MLENSMAPDRDMGKNRTQKLIFGNGDSIQNTQYSASTTGSFRSCSFQFFVHSDDGLNLSVELNSNPLEWMRACSNGIRVPQHLHRLKPNPTLESREESTRSIVAAEFFSADRGVGFQRGFCNGSGFELVCGDGRSGNGESSAGCIGQKTQTELQVLTDVPRAMGDLCAVQSEASENGVVHGVDQHGLPLSVSGLDCESRDVGMPDQGVLHVSREEIADQHFAQAHEALQNKDEENPRHLQVDAPVESTSNEVNCTHSMILNFRDKPPRYKVDIKKAPNVKNLRTIKTLARGPIAMEGSTAKARRKSARLIHKGP